MIRKKMFKWVGTVKGIPFNIYSFRSFDIKKERKDHSLHSSIPKRIEEDLPIIE